MKLLGPIFCACLVLSLAACSGGQLSVDLPGDRTGTLDLDFPPERAVEHRLPFRISGGFPPYTVTIAGCPGWATLFPDQAILAGTSPAEDQGRSFFCTYRVTDSATPPMSKSFGLRLNVGLPEPLVLPAVDDQTFMPGTYRSIALPAASDGIRPYTYAFTCANGSLPPGIGFAPETRILAGTPTAGFRDSCTYSVTDSAEPPVTVSNALQVRVTSANLALPRPSDISLSIAAFYSHTLPTASGGVRPYTYAFTCAGGTFPPGIGFAPETRTLAGTPTRDFHDSCAYSVTDSSRPPATVSYPVQVQATTGDLSLPAEMDISLTIAAFYSRTLTAASGGVPPYSYAFTCAGGTLPPGIGFAPETRTLAGTPGGAFEDSCAYSVTDSSLPPVTLSNSLRVQATGGVTLPANVVPGDEVNSLSLYVQRHYRVQFAEAAGGVPPYTYELLDCDPSGVAFSPDTRTLSGTPSRPYRGPECTYRVTDSASPPVSVSRGVALTVLPLDLETWRFRVRTVAPSEHPLNRMTDPQVFTTLPLAIGGTGTATYELVDVAPPLAFGATNRQLTFTYPGVDPLLDSPFTLRYQVSSGGMVHDALCVDITYKDNRPEGIQDDLLDTVAVEIREDAYWDGKEYRCPDSSPSSRSIGRARVSNPVHAALGPVHARHAVNVAHATVRDRVRKWSPRAPPKRPAFFSSIGFTSLSGLSEGFDYTGSGESLSAGAELGADSWQAGLAASFARTDLRYRAAPRLAEAGYRSGEHDTEVFSVHPFAAWHWRSGAHLWASLGAGLGELRHRDDAGFPSRARSDVRLRAYAAGASVPLTEVWSGQIDAEAGLESFRFEIEGGSRISTELPPLRGHDYRAGLAWSAPVTGRPSVSLAYKRLTGDGPEGTLVEARGSTSAAGILHPRLTLTAVAEASVGLGAYEQDTWGVGGVVRFAPYGSGHGFGLVLDSRLASLADDGRSAGLAVRGEAGYGLWVGPSVGIMRPYVGLARDPANSALRRTLGLDLRDTPTSKLTVEVHDHRRRPTPVLGVTFTLRRRF